METPKAGETWMTEKGLVVEIEIPQGEGFDGFCPGTQGGCWHENLEPIGIGGYTESTFGRLVRRVSIPHPDPFLIRLDEREILRELIEREVKSMDHTQAAYPAFASTERFVDNRPALNKILDRWSKP